MERKKIMRNKWENKIQKFSLRKYKGIGAASVLLGLMCLAATPVFAQDTTTTSKETIETSNDNIKMETLSNAAGSYTMPRMHVFSLSDGGGRLHGDENWYEKKHKQFEETAKRELKRVEDSNIKKQGTSPSFVT